MKTKKLSKAKRRAATAGAEEERLRATGLLTSHYARARRGPGYTQHTQPQASIVFGPRKPAAPGIPQSRRLTI